MDTPLGIKSFVTDSLPKFLLREAVYATSVSAKSLRHKIVENKRVPIGCHRRPADNKKCKHLCRTGADEKSAAHKGSRIPAGQKC